MPRKVAIVLRGAPGAGKTTLSKKLEAHYQGLLGRSLVSFVSLDKYWGHGEKRFAGSCRYWDLRDPAKVLIIELGWGEPAGEQFSGASRNPGEWLSVLESENREVFSFLLLVPKKVSEQRVIERGDLKFHEHPWERYDENGECTHFKFGQRAGAGFNEKVIKTDEKCIEKTMKELVDAIGEIN